jgi:outer membrane protein insertion porin family/translocation and assembly module TamA
VTHLTLKRTAGALAIICALTASTACKEGEGISVRSLAFEGVHQVPESELRLALSTTTTAKVPWASKIYFSRREFDEDLKQIESFYASRGFPDARVVSYNAHYNQDKTSIDLTVKIDEGQPVTVEAIVFDGFAPLPDQHLQELKTRIPVTIGAPRDQEKVQMARGMALDELRDHGFPKATVALAETPGATPRGLVVTLTATPGPYATFGDVKISGLTSIGRDVVLRQMSAKPGEEFRLSSLQRSQRQLYGLELFRFVNVEVGEITTTAGGGGDPKSEVSTNITVIEAPHRQATFGVGYGSEDHARVSAKFTHVNFLGGARVGSAEGKFSSLERGVRLSFTEPALGHGLSAAINGQSWYASTPAYTLRTTGGRIGLLKTLSRSDVAGGSHARGSVSLSFAREYESYDVTPAALADLDFRPTLLALGLNPSTGTGRGTVSAVIADAQRNTILNLLDARGGSLLSIHAEAAARVAGGDFSYRELSGEGRGYWSLNPTVILAGHLRAGSIGATGDPQTSVPFFKRYFLGGANSLRGWGRFEVAPLTSEGLPIGGFSMLESSGEIRLSREKSAFGVVAFVDAGNVWNKSWRIFANDLRTDVGVGLRYRTVVGPIRLDVAYQLTPEDDLVIKGLGAGQYRRFRIHFSIGQAF